MTNPRVVASVSKALRLLELMAERRSPLALAEAATETGLSKGAVHALLSTLRAHGYAQQTPDRRYSLGTSAIRLGIAALPDLPVPGRLISALWELSTKTGEAVSLAIRDGCDALIVHRVESNNILRADLGIGVRMPLHASASGRAILAKMPDEEVELMYAASGLPATTPKTVTDFRSLRTELSRIRETGYANSIDEYIVGISGIATLVPGDGSKISVAMSIATPTVRFNAKRLQSALAAAIAPLADQPSRENLT